MSIAELKRKIENYCQYLLIGKNNKCLEIALFLPKTASIEGSNGYESCLRIPFSDVTKKVKNSRVLFSPSSSSYSSSPFSLLLS